MEPVVQTFPGIRLAFLRPDLHPALPAQPRERHRLTPGAQRRSERHRHRLVDVDEALPGVGGQPANLPVVRRTGSSPSSAHDTRPTSSRQLQGALSPGQHHERRGRAGLHSSTSRDLTAARGSTSSASINEQPALGDLSTTEHASRHRARTYSKPKKYFYRTFANGESGRAGSPAPSDLDGDHVRSRWSGASASTSSGSPSSSRVRPRRRRTRPTTPTGPPAAPR